MARILLIGKENEESKAAEDVLSEHHGYDVDLAERDVRIKDASDSDYAAAVLLSTADAFSGEKKLKAILARIHASGKPVGAVGKASKLLPVPGLIMAPDASAIKQLCQALVNALESLEAGRRPAKGIKKAWAGMRRRKGKEYRASGSNGV